MNIQSIVKKGAPSVEPHELAVILDESDPLFDARLYLDIKDEAVLNFAAAGQVQPIAVRARGDEMVIVDGLQRWKRATVINHLAGKCEYVGSVKSISEAIERLKDSPIGRRIVELAPRGMKLYVSVYRGNEKESLGAKVSANVWREDDAISEYIRKAQQMARHAFNVEEIAAALGKSEATIEKYLNADPDKPAVRKKKGKHVKPGTKRLKELATVAAESEDDDVQSLGVIFGWLAGTKTEADVLAEWPELADSLKASKKRKAA